MRSPRPRRRRVRGFIDCPNGLEAPDNVFASSAAPIVLGHFGPTQTF